MNEREGAILNGGRTHWLLAISENGQIFEFGERFGRIID